jgi:heptosyltransferase-2
MPYPEQPQSILVRAPNWIGDQVLAYPFFYYLRQGYPKARITSACMPWVASVQFRHLVDEVCLLPAPAAPSMWARARALEQGARLLRAGGSWDLGLCLSNAFSSAWLLARAHVQWRRGYATDGRGWLLHDRLRWPPQALRHRAEAYVYVLPESVRPRRPVQDFWSRPVRQHGSPATPPVFDQFEARQAWPVDGLVEPPMYPYWVLAPGSMAASRRWPEERFATLARQIAAATGMTGLVVGGTGEAAIAARLCQEAPLHLANLTARGTVAAYWQVFRQARFTVSNDSGLAHVAALCGSPVYIVWGAGDPRKTRPLGPGPVSIVHHPVDCWPCERNVCCQLHPRKIACLRGIDPDTVWAAISRLPLPEGEGGG